MSDNPNSSEGSDSEPRLVKIDQRAVITNTDGQVCLVKESKDDSWDLPGGIMVAGDNWRETLEGLIGELLDMQIVANHPVYACDYLNPSNGEYVYVSFVHADAFKDTFEEDHFAEVKWFSIDDIGALAFSTFDAKDAIFRYFELSSN